MKIRTEASYEAKDIPSVDNWTCDGLWKFSLRKKTPRNMAPPAHVARFMNLIRLAETEAAKILVTSPHDNHGARVQRNSRMAMLWVSEFGLVV